MDERNYFKGQAESIEERAQQLRRPILHMTALELVAASHGFPSWNTLLTELKMFEAGFEHTCASCRIPATTLQDAIRLLGYSKHPTFSIHFWCKQCRGITHAL